MLDFLKSLSSHFVAVVNFEERDFFWYLLFFSLLFWFVWGFIILCMM